MNGATIMGIAAGVLAMALLFLTVHHGPTGLMRAAGLWVVESADSIDSRWGRIRAGHQEVLRRLADVKSDG